MNTMNTTMTTVERIDAIIEKTELTPADELELSTALTIHLHQNLRYEAQYGDMQVNVFTYEYDNFFTPGHVFIIDYNFTDAFVVRLKAFDIHLQESIELMGELFRNLDKQAMMVFEDMTNNVFQMDLTVPKEHMDKGVVGQVSTFARWYENTDELAYLHVSPESLRVPDTVESVLRHELIHLCQYLTLRMYSMRTEALVGPNVAGLCWDGIIEPVDYMSKASEIQAHALMYHDDGLTMAFVENFESPVAKKKLQDTCYMIESYKLQDDEEEEWDEYEEE